jgi:predicted transposase YdaD
VWEGRKEGRKEGKKEGRKEGSRKGRKEGGSVEEVHEARTTDESGRIDQAMGEEERERMA